MPTKAQQMNAKVKSVTALAKREASKKLKKEISASKAKARKAANSRALVNSIKEAAHKEATQILAKKKLK